jgi:ferric-dicitrate binding protein FerR (iron transport regulator)
MIRNWRFYATVRRYLAGNMREAEKEQFDRFLDETTLPAADTQWSAAEKAALLNRITKKIHEPVKKRMSTQRFIVTATLVTMLLLAGYYAVLTLAVRPAAGQMEKILLADGTIVWLKPGDKLSYYETASGRERHALLTGEALFEVAKDSLRPFIVQCGSTSLRVLGTSFTVRSVNDSVMLTVLTGSVRMYSSDDTTGVRVQPDEHVTYAGKGIIRKLARPAHSVPSYIYTTEYNMRFTDATVEQLAARIEKKFDVNVVVNDTRVSRCHITADFTDHSLDQTLRMLAEVLGITYTVNGTTVTIFGTGCD